MAMDEDFSGAGRGHAKVSIGTVWDRTTEILSGRGGPIASVAVLTLFAPTVVQAAITAFLPQGTMQALVGGLISLVSAVLTIWGSLVILGLATYPSTDRAAAQAQASRRVLPVIGVSIVLMLIVIAATLPIVVVLVVTGFDFGTASAAMEASAPALMPRLAPSAAIFILVYMLVLFLAALWASARLMLVNAVLLNEPVGLRAISRSIALTRGQTWKLIGVLVLFGIVFGIALLAAQSVTGLVFRLILGANGIPTAVFMGAVAGAAVSAAALSLVYVFTAQLYVATRERQAP